MKLERVTISSSPDDPFADFRDVALVQIKHQFNYRHSLGKTSKFFLELENEKLFATRCPACAAVYMPPRALCPEDLNVTEWLELSGKGTLESWTLCPYPPSYAETEKPYFLAYIRLEGTNSLFLHQLRNITPGQLTYGLRVKTVFGHHTVNHPLERFWFEPFQS